ncbi:MAG: xanthine dehydrogenase family protein molybdopterin-binding subunit [Acidimicrobiales bacterium]
MTSAERSSRPGGVGARQRRNEDRRHLRGEATFVADIALPGMLDVAFVRSQVAHGRLSGVEAPAQGRCFVADDLAPLARPIVADAAHPGFRSSAYPILATDKVRFVGEPVAAVLGADRAEAEDSAADVVVDVDPLPAVVDMDDALQADAALVHDHWPDNRFLEATGGGGDLDAAAAAADLTITRQFRMARHAGVPLETRGCVAHYDGRTDQLVLYSSTQFPHVIRSVLAQQLDMEEHRLRVVAPDVGGGFGIKNNLYPEEVALCALALIVGRPLRWIEDRWEHLVGSAQAREHRYTMTAHAGADGTLLGVDARITVDAGAYSVWPWTATMEAGMAAGIIPGPYLLDAYRFVATTVATNKPPLGPYRGVARPGACFAIERTVDEVALALGLEAKDVRRRNMVPPERFPHTSVTGKVYDSGDFAATLDAAVRLIDHDAVRSRQRSGTARVGVGYASYTEQTAHGQAEWVARGLPVTFGFESATVAIDPSGALTVRVGIQSHGQGLETTLAQVACEVLGVDPAGVHVVHGDTETAPYGMGTFASRSMVMAGGATYRACQQLGAKITAIAAHLLGCEIADLQLSGGKVQGPTGTVTLAEVADAAYLHMERLPRDIDPCLEVTDRYRPEVETGTFASSTHAAVVQVDVTTGEVVLLDYAVAEDCGRVVNPMIVDGQIHGGVAQGIGTALLEESTFDDEGQPRATTFMDYLLPGATEVPDIKIEHLETLSPFTVLGVKGMGEGGAIAPPAAIANAVTDALHDLGVSMVETPMTPRRVWHALTAGSS